MSHAEGVLLLDLTRDTGMGMSPSKPPDFYGSPSGWAVPPLQQLRPPPMQPWLLFNINQPLATVTSLALLYRFLAKAGTR
jgi:hypothetical protein